jgi:uncharacterized phage protein (TIGR02218 family)
MLEVPEEQILGGVFDGAKITASWASWENPALGKIDVFAGTLGQISWDERGWLADVVSNMKLLERTLGWTYTATCRHKLFSTAETGKIGFCGLDPASYTFTGSVSAVSTPKWKFSTSLTQADAYFSAAVLTWTSGNNAGLSCTVKSQIGGVLDLFVPTAFTIQAGDTFSIQAGCDKTAETCASKFSNLNNFGGFPHIQSDVNFK